jgi:hypothetical protein
VYWPKGLNATESNLGARDQFCPSNCHSAGVSIIERPEMDDGNDSSERDAPDPLVGASFFSNAQQISPKAPLNSQNAADGESSASPSIC